jgi:hypothetical protein
MIRNIIFAVLAFGTAFGVASYTYYIHRQLISSNEEVKKLRSQLLSNDAVLISKDEKVDVELNKLSEQISILDESISPEDKRWARVKKVRKAIQDTIDSKGYKKHLDINGLTNNMMFLFRLFLR